MRVRDLTPPELADLLDAAYRQDRGLQQDGPDPFTRMELADLLGCHEDLRAEVLEAWRPLMSDERGYADPDEAEYWLDVEFVEPCPEDTDGPRFTH